jgi:hypothetical protein
MLTQGYAVDRNWLGLRALGSAQHRREKRRDGCLSVGVVRDCCAECDLSLKNMSFSLEVVLNNPVAHETVTTIDCNETHKSN